MGAQEEISLDVEEPVMELPEELRDLDDDQEEEEQEVSLGLIR